MFPGRYSEIFGLGERPGCILNSGHSFDAFEAYLCDDYKEFGDFELYNAWQLIQH